jgi:hypothetical protein
MRQEHVGHGAGPDRRFSSGSERFVKLVMEVLVFLTDG